MTVTFYIAAAVAMLATALAITRLHAMHALLYLIVSLLAVAVVFYVMGAPFAAALEIIVYAGAIIVLLVFAVMMLNLGRDAAQTERRWFPPRWWRGPAVLAAILLTEMLILILRGAAVGSPAEVIEASGVARLLFGPYLIAVELVSMLLLAALVGAFRLARLEDPPARPRHAAHSERGET